MNLLIFSPRSDSNYFYRKLRTVYKDMHTKYGEVLLRSRVRMSYVRVSYESMVKSLTTIESSTSTERVQGIISQYMTKRVEYTPISVEKVGDLK